VLASTLQLKKEEKLYHKVELLNNHLDLKYNPNGIRKEKNEFKYSTGASYKGEWIGGFRDGHGKQSWPDGAYYIGDWKDNVA
jgi:hypothetical protein